MKYFKVEKYGRVLVHSGGEVQRDGENVWLTSESGKRASSFHESELGRSVTEITKQQFEALRQQQNRLEEMEPIPRCTLEHGMTPEEWRMRHGSKTVDDVRNGY